MQNAAGATSLWMPSVGQGAMPSSSHSPASEVSTASVGHGAMPSSWLSPASEMSTDAVLLLVRSWSLGSGYMEYYDIIWTIT